MVKLYCVVIVLEAVRASCRREIGQVLKVELFFPHALITLLTVSSASGWRLCAVFSYAKTTLVCPVVSKGNACYFIQM